VRQAHAVCWLLLGIGACAALSATGVAAAASDPGIATPPPVAASATPDLSSPAAPPAAPAKAPELAPPADHSAETPHERPLQYAITYRLDTRAGARTGEPGLQVGGMEAEFVGSYGRKWEFAGQVPVASEFSSRGRGMHFGNLYALRKWRLGAPTLKFGQFVVPFSNLTTYDVHSRIIQSLYRYSLGVRIDGGAEVEGYLPGGSEWQVAVTTGTGPYRLQHVDTPLITGRVSHKFDQGGNAIKLGLSAADGVLPVFSVTGEPVSFEGSPVLAWKHKQRLALDAEVERGVDLIRLEGALGTDGGKAARGLSLGWARPLNAKSTVEAALESWHQPERDGGLWGAWLGAEHRLDGARTARVALRWCRARESSQTQSQLSLLGQFVRQF
jgi:hypothetical protein